MSEPPIADPQLLAAYRKTLALHGGTEEVTGVDIGFLYVDGRRTEDLCVRVHLGGVPPHLWSKTAEALPAEIDGVRISPVPATYRLHGSTAPNSLSSDLLSSRSLLPHLRRTKMRDPIQPGVSVSHHKLQGGTLGLIVYDLHTGAPCILSNWHVLADHPNARPDDAVIQPGASHGGRAPTHTIAALDRFIFDEDGDAAIAKLNRKRGVNPAQMGSDVVIAAARMPSIGEVLVKSGVRTGVTYGLVDGLGRYFLRRRVENVSVVGMDGFKIVPVDDGNANDREISGPGDSGATWYGRDDHHGVGLHVAGETSANPTQEHGIACYLPRVIDRLALRLTPPDPLVNSFVTPLEIEGFAQTGDSQSLLTESVARLARVVELLLSDHRDGT